MASAGRLAAKLRKMCVIKDRTLMWTTAIFIYIPVVLWLFMWCNLVIALISSSAIAYGAYRFMKGVKGETEYSIPVLILLTAVSTVILVLSGYGAIFEQSYDWYKSNSVMSDMVNRENPVYYENISGGVTEKAMLTYYLGVYMVPACAGKIFGEGACGFVLLIQTVMAIVLLWMHLCRILKIRDAFHALAPAVLILFFNFPTAQLAAVRSFLSDMGVSTANQACVNGIGSVQLYTFDIYNGSREPVFALYGVAERWAVQCFRGSALGQTDFLPHYAIMLITAVWYGNREKTNSYMFIWAPMLLYCSISIPYIFLIVAGTFVYRLVKDGDRIPAIRDNAVSFLSAVPVMVYISGNVFGAKEGACNSLSVIPVNIVTILYPLTCVLPFYILLFRANRKDGMFHAVFALLAAACFLSYGMYNDLMMSGSTPLMTLMFVFMLKAVLPVPVAGCSEGSSRAGLSGTAKAGKVILAFILLTGAVYAYNIDDDGGKGLALNNEYESVSKRDLLMRDCGMDAAGTIFDYDTVLHTTPLGNTYGSMSQFADRNGRYEFDLKYNYFTYDYPDSLFCKYFARK